MSSVSRSDEAIFQAARRIDAAEARSAYLDQTCREDAKLRKQVEALLAAYDASQSFLESPAVDFAATTDQPPITERPGTVIGPYKLLQQIGEGGMGAVFMAEQTEPLQRTVALKIIKPGMDTRQVIARFEAERQALAMMDHPNIARVLDAGTTGEGSRVQGPGTRADGAYSLALDSRPSALDPPTGRPYFVMDLVKGVPITDYCDQQHLPVRQRLELFTQVCQAVQHAHQKGIIHRDLKPSNVLVAEYDGKPVPKVIDFGVAKATAQRLTERTMFTEFGQVIGTVEYMSPEQARFNHLDIDTRSDVYSLGVLLYELLVGTTPLDKGRLETSPFDETLRIIREEDPPKPSTRLSRYGESNRTLSGSLPLARGAGEQVCAGATALATIAANRGAELSKLASQLRNELDWIVMKCLEKDRNRRYETVAALAADLDHYLHDEPIAAASPSQLYRASKFVRRNKVLVVASAAVFAGLVIGIVGTSIGLVGQSRQRAIAERERQQAQLNLASSLISQDNFAEAETIYRESLAAVGDTPEDRQRAARIQLRLAWIRSDERLYRKAIDAHREAFPPGDPSLAYALQEFGLVLRSTGRATSAEPLLREAYEIRRNARPVDHLATGVSAVYYAYVLRLLHRFNEAEQMARVSIVEYQLAKPLPEKRIAFARLELGCNLFLLGRRAEAERELLAAAQVFESDQDHLWGELSLAWLYMAWDIAEPGKGYDVKFREWFLKTMGDYGSQLPVQRVEANDSK